jgi:hypothetical protein
MSSNVALMGARGADRCVAAVSPRSPATGRRHAPHGCGSADAPGDDDRTVKRLVAGNAALKKLADSTPPGLIEPRILPRWRFTRPTSRARHRQVLPVDSGVTIREIASERPYPDGKRIFGTTR